MSALHSRAYLLLQKELFKVKQAGVWGINVELVDDNLFQWRVFLAGLKGTLWQDGEFVLLVDYSEDYNIEAPEVMFQTIPFHPNVDSRSGRVCLGCLEQWNQVYSSLFLLLSIQNILSEPCLENVINKEALVLIRSYPRRYKQLVLDCVLESKRSRYNPPITFVSNNSPPNEHQLKKQAPDEGDKRNINEVAASCKLSYDEYLKAWREIGSTNHAKQNENSLSGLLDTNFHQTDYDSIKTEVDDEVHRQLFEHRKLMFGQFENDGKNSAKRLTANKMALLKEMDTNKSEHKSVKIALPSSPRDDMVNEKDIDVLEANDILA